MQLENQALMMQKMETWMNDQSLYYDRLEEEVDDIVIYVFGDDCLCDIND